jgi:hypothetical protein
MTHNEIEHMLRNMISKDQLKNHFDKAKNDIISELKEHMLSEGMTEEEFDHMNNFMLGRKRPDMMKIAKEMFPIQPMPQGALFYDISPDEEISYDNKE